jgi:hypothetical protein
MVDPGQPGVESLCVLQVADDELEPLVRANVREMPLAARAEVVEHGDAGRVLVEQPAHQMAADEAGSARDEVTRHAGMATESWRRRA